MFTVALNDAVHSLKCTQECTLCKLLTLRAFVRCVQSVQYLYIRKRGEDTAHARAQHIVCSPYKKVFACARTERTDRTGSSPPLAPAYLNFRLVVPDSTPVARSLASLLFSVLAARTNNAFAMQRACTEVSFSPVQNAVSVQTRANHVRSAFVLRRIAIVEGVST